MFGFHDSASRKTSAQNPVRVGYSLPSSSPPRTLIPRLRPLLSGKDVYMKVKWMVYLLDRSDFELGPDFLRSTGGPGTHNCLFDTCKCRPQRVFFGRSSARSPSRISGSGAEVSSDSPRRQTGDAISLQRKMEIFDNYFDVSVR